jgi:hypothetical protein
LYSTLKNEIAHYEERKEEYGLYKLFLEELTPPEWREVHPFPELYYKEPKQLLEKIQALEDENLFLIRHCQ